jgi:hypothetical protein
VAATDAMDQKASFSGYGFKCVDISAPGVSMFSTSYYYPEKFINNYYFDKYYDGYWSGTSMAVPIISGAFALLEQYNPNLSRKELVALILNSADNINRLNPDYLSKLGKGRINIANSAIGAKSILYRNKIGILFTKYLNGDGKIYYIDEKGENKQEIAIYDKITKNSINITAGDVDSDGKDEIITVASTGGLSNVKILNANGQLLNQFFAYDKKFLGGVNIAAGDVNGDGKDEIIVAPVTNGGPHIKIFNINGGLISQFFAYDKNFRGGVNLAAGDIDGDGKDEIVTGPGVGGGPHVRVFRSDGSVLMQFFAYDQKFRDGINIAVGDIDNIGIRNNNAEIIVSPSENNNSNIKIFNNHAKLLYQFSAFHKKFKGGVYIATLDVNYDGSDEIIASAGSTGSPHIRIFDKKGNVLQSFYAMETDYLGGIKISKIKF